MATLKDISKIADVNISTVSKALRGSSDINPQTVARIQKIADQLNYKREIYDLSDNGKKPPLIGIVCPEVVSMYYADILNSLQMTFLEAGYQSVAMISNFDRAQEVSCIKSLAAMNVCGIVFLTENDVDADDLKELSFSGGINFVIVSNDNNNDFCDSICIDDGQSVAMAVAHLIELGHSKIAYIGDTLSAGRRQAYLQTMESHSKPVNPGYVIENRLRFEECGYHGMKNLLTLENPPTAIFTAYDNVAIGAMRAIYESGFSVPEDFSVLGIDNLKTSSYLYKTLTSITEPTADLGELAGDLMVNRLRKQTAVRHIKLIPTLNTRETTAALEAK